MEYPRQRIINRLTWAGIPKEFIYGELEDVDMDHVESRIHEYDVAVEIREAYLLHNPSADVPELRRPKKRVRRYE